ncbi:MAG TPA: helix-turn-helix domain-containing protein [candidate division Zixibacteria bacterium]|nr:helix-turn-helix domain-containing protein [candidate division Zixibacteria bacterium]
MTSVVDLWRAIEPSARLLAGPPEALIRPVRGVARTRSAPPHLPPSGEAQLLVVDGRLGLSPTVETLVLALAEAGLEPAAVLLAAAPGGLAVDRGASAYTVLASEHPPGALADAAARYLADERGWLAGVANELRLACAEAGLAEPELSAPAGLVAAKLRRGVAVTVDGELRTLHARPAGRALAARFAAIHRRLPGLAGGGRAEIEHRILEGLWVLERRLTPTASVWVFDDVPLAAVDEVAAAAVAVTLRALLRRPAPPRVERAGREVDHEPGKGPPPDLPPVLRETLLAVARANGRTATAARALGVHRNTVLYRLRRARAELGLDPRRPEDALRILSRWAVDGR